MRLILVFIMLVSIQLNWAQEKQTCRCCADEYRQFDFWVGDWEAFDPTGKLVGTNDIKILQDSCTIQENWVSDGGKYTGTSYNFYDVSTKKWHQTWIDNQGGNLQLVGELVDGKMVLASKPMMNQDGKPYVNRITWTPYEDKSVRQLWEISKDNGITWMVALNGLYKLKEKKN